MSTTYTTPHALYWAESAEDERRNQAEHERRVAAEQIADFAEEQQPDIFNAEPLARYIAIRAALITAALEGMEERKAS